MTKQFIRIDCIRITRLERECGSLQPIHKIEYDDIHIIYEYGFGMHTGQKVTRKKDKFDDKKRIKIKAKQIISEQTRYGDEDNKRNYYGFVNENIHLNMKTDLYMSNIYSRISLQAIEFYSQICEKTRNIRQLTLTQVQKNTPLLGYILSGYRSIFVKQEGLNVMKMYNCAKKSSPLYVPQTLCTSTNNTNILMGKESSMFTLQFRRINLNRH